MTGADSQKTILIVDDTPSNVTVINALLCGTYRTRVATSGKAALDLLGVGPLPDLVLMDVVMPDMDGYAVCRALQADARTAELPVIFLTASNDVADEVKGFESGAVDYITKPISPPTLLARVKNHLLLTEARRYLRTQNEELERRVGHRTQEIGMLQEATIVALASLAETRDNETANHVRRTQRYVRILAQELQKQTRFAKFITPEWLESLFRSSALHDIGKVGIPDRILLKPGKLTDAEFEIMKTHSRLGSDAIAAAERHLESSSTFLAMAGEIALSHHEKWDGKGYPLGLSGEDIPLAARLMALADVYDALISKRVYKPAFPHEKAVAIIREGRGNHFDPVLVDAFEQVCEQFRQLALELPDSDEEVERKARASDFSAVNP